MDADEPSYPDWAVTATFYAAVHYVNHYFMRTVGVAPRDHIARSSYLNRDSRTRTIAFEYGTLKSKCYQARYYCVQPTPQQACELLGNELEKVNSATLLNSPP